MYQKEARKPLLFVLILAIILVFAGISYAENLKGIGATSGTCGTNLTWELADGTLTISGSGAMENYSSSIGAPWESVKGSITAVVINSDVTSVGDYAFYECTNLAGVNLPATVRTIGEYAFGGCSKLPEITLQENLTSLKGYAFYGCSALKSIDFPASLTNIGSYCFSHSGLQSMTIPDTVKTIGVWAFSSCSSLKQIVFPAGITVIPGFVAYNCYNLEEATISQGTEEISSSAFSSCSKLKTITIPAALTSVASSAFSGCSSLSEVKYAGTLAQANAISVGTSNTYFTGATWTCSDGTVTGIGATSGACGAELTWKLENGTLTVSGSGAMENYSSSTGAPWESVKSNIKAVVINSDAASVGDYAFYGCTNLAGVSLPATIQTIGEYAFGGCGKLPEITLQENLTSLKGYAFYGCSALKSIAFPASLTSIGSYCFSRSGLQSTAIPNTVNEIGSWAFSSCSSLKKIVFPDGITAIPGFVAYNCDNLEEVILGEGTEEISSSAFSSGSKLKTITIPATLTSVASSAFSGCSSLSEVKYAGTEAQANAISIGTGNTYFTGATWSFGYRYKFTITFDSDGGSTVDPMTVEYGATVTAPANPTKAGWVFVAWVPALPETMPAEDIAVKATWAVSQAEVDAVIALINQLPANAGISDKTAVETARAAYNALTDDQKALISADILKKLTDAEAQVAAAEQAAADLAANQAAADAVAVLINQLPANAGIQDKPAVLAARAAYDALTDAQKALISADLLKRLTDAEAQVAAAEQSAADQAAADAVAALINKLPANVGAQDKAAVQAIRAAYDALTDAQKALISAGTLKKLTDAEAQVAAAEQAPADQAAANIVIEMIRQLPEPAGLQDKAAVEAARAAYNALTDAQKALISADILKKLTDAEAQVAAEQSAADQAAANIVIDMIRQLPEPAGLQDKAAVEAARAAYNALTDAQKALISEEILKKLTDAEAQVAAAEETALPTGSYTDPDGSGEYNISENGSATYVSPGSDAETVTIPDSLTVNGHTVPVTAIEDRAFYKNEKLKTVVIGKNVKLIGRNAFASCKRLVTVKGGKNIETIMDSAFASCQKLKNFPVLSKLKKIGNSAFAGNKALTQFTFGAKVEKIGKKAFSDCVKLKTIMIKTKKLTNKNVGANAFKNISKKATVKCPKGKLKEYRKLLAKKGMPGTVTFK